jgi:hypothetical protein
MKEESDENPESRSDGHQVGEGNRFPAGTIDQVTFSRSEGIISTAHTVRVSLAIDWRFFFAGIEPYTGFPLRSNPLG